LLKTPETGLNRAKSRTRDKGFDYTVPRSRKEGTVPYTFTNFKTKKALKEAVALASVPVYQPGPFGPDVADGQACIEGPHYPEPHRWWASVTVKNGVIPQGSKVS
jgi:hypothetical protein